jgi:hypothetical protein
MINSDDVLARVLEVYNDAARDGRYANPYTHPPSRYLRAVVTAMTEAVNRELAVDKPAIPEVHPAGVAVLDACPAPPVELACGHPVACLVQSEFGSPSFCQACEALNRMAERDGQPQVSHEQNRASTTSWRAHPGGR